VDRNFRRGTVIRSLSSSHTIPFEQVEGRYSIRGYTIIQGDGMDQRYTVIGVKFYPRFRGISTPLEFPVYR
jgi:hypothetical protein